MQRILRTPGTIVISTLLLILIATGVANAAALINSGDVKNNSLQSKDIKDNTLQSGDVKNNSLQGKDIKDGTLQGADVKNDSLKSGDLAAGSVGSSEIADGSVSSSDIKNGTVAAADLAPGAVAFPNTLWGTVLRNQTGAAESGFQAGPGVPPSGDGSLRLFVSGTADVAAFGDSFDFAGFQLEDITDLSYATYNADDPPLVRPSLRIEIDPHLVSDTVPGGALEFTTLAHQPEAPGATGWETHADALADALWSLTGDEGTTTGCTQDDPCTFTEVLSALDTNGDPDNGTPAISTGVYFGLGTGVASPTETAVDAFVVNNFQFDFEPMGAFLTPATP